MFNCGYTGIHSLQADGGVDVVIEMLANANLETDMELCHLNSRIAVSSLYSFVVLTSFAVQCSILCNVRTRNISKAIVGMTAVTHSSVVG